jgi:hypothetical protein
MYYYPFRIRNRPVIDYSNVTYLSDVTLPCKKVPSDNVYFSEFLYKITFEGSSVWHDMDFHFGLSAYVEHNCAGYRMGWSTKCRSIYFNRFEDVKNVATMFKSGVIAVHGPASEDHLRQINGESVNKGFNTIYRDKLYYSKYDAKIEFRYDKSFGSGLYNTTRPINKIRENRRELRENIEHLIAVNVSDHKWHSRNLYVHYNSVFLHYDDAEMLLPILKITYKEYLIDTIRVLLKETLL